MPVLISMLRGVNVGPHHRMKMDALRAVYESLELQDPRTYVQSGNVIFRTKEKNVAALGKKIQKAIEQEFGIELPADLEVTAVEDTPDHLHLVVPVNRTGLSEERLIADQAAVNSCYCSCSSCNCSACACS